MHKWLKCMVSLTPEMADCGGSHCCTFRDAGGGLVFTYADQPLVHVLSLPRLEGEDDDGEDDAQDGFLRVTYERTSTLSLGIVYVTTPGPNSLGSGVVSVMAGQLTDAVPIIKHTMIKLRKD